MTFSPRFRIALVLAPTVFSFAALSTAQTLEHRPAPKPNEPTETHSPVLPVLPKGTSLQVETSRHYPMKAGEAIEARLLHPIFCHGEMAVPANTTLHGHVVSLGPDTKTRWHGRLRGDFTPFQTVQVQFDEMGSPSGPLGISTTVADNGAPVLRLLHREPRRSNRSFRANGHAPRAIFMTGWSTSRRRARPTGRCSCSTTNCPTIRNALTPKPPGRLS